MSNAEMEYSPLWLCCRRLSGRCAKTTANQGLRQIIVKELSYGGLPRKRGWCIIFCGMKFVHAGQISSHAEGETRCKTITFR